MKYRLQRVDLRKFLEVEVPAASLSAGLAQRIRLALANDDDLRDLTVEAVRELVASGVLARTGKLQEPSGAVPVYSLPNSSRVYDLRRFLGSGLASPASDPGRPAASEEPHTKSRAIPQTNGEAWASLEAIRATLRRDWVSLGLEAAMDGLVQDLRVHLADPGLQFVLWEERFDLPISEGREWSLRSESDPAAAPLLRALSREGDGGLVLDGRRWFGCWSRQQVLGAVGVRTDVPRSLGSEAAAALGDLLSGYRRSQRRVYADPLTGANNRGYFDHQFPVELERSRRASSPLALLFADLDHFKRVNDTYGHEAGDAALQHATRLFEGGLRRIDYVFRWGGEEFALLLPATDREEAMNTAERVRALLEASPLLLADGQQLALTASFGVALFPEHGRDPQELMRNADAALYEAKRAGRNRVCLHGT